MRAQNLHALPEYPALSVAAQPMLDASEAASGASYRGAQRTIAISPTVCRGRLDRVLEAVALAEGTLPAVRDAGGAGSTPGIPRVREGLPSALERGLYGACLERSMGVANSLGLGQHPLIRREHFESRDINFPCCITVDNKQSAASARMFLDGSRERPQLARDCFGRSQGRTDLYELLIAGAIPDQEVDFKTLWGLYVAHLGAPPLELVHDGRLEQVAQVRASASIGSRNHSRVGELDLSARSQNLQVKLLV